MFLGRVCFLGEYVSWESMFLGRVCFLGKYVSWECMFPGRVCFMCRVNLLFCALNVVVDQIVIDGGFLV